MTAALPDDLGATDIGEIRQAGLEAFGDQPDVSQRPIDQLCEKVLDVAKARLSDPVKAAVEKGPKGFAIFLMTTELRKDRDRLNAHRVPNLDAGSERLAGRIWIVPPSMAAAGRLEISSSCLGDAFTEIEDQNLGCYAAIVIDFENSELRIYETGVAQEENVLKVTIGHDDLSQVSLLELLQTFAHECVVTPNCQTPLIKVWSDSGAYIPAEAAEKKIQELLFQFLRARLVHTHKIEQEVTLRSGRVDLVVRRKLGPGLWETIAAVELKVARSFSFTGKPKSPSFLVKHIARGYRQIREYKTELEATHGWIVAYDMRRLDARAPDPFSAHRQAAAVDGINLHVEPLFGSADDYRDSRPG